MSPATAVRDAKAGWCSTCRRGSHALCEAIVEADDMDWWRIALFGTPHAAGRVKVALAAEFPEGWEWKSARDDEGRPAVFVRRVEA